jgi:hypothetical protein
MRVIERIDCSPSVLGYYCWLVLDRFGACDQLVINQEVANCHPAISAQQMHVDQIHGVQLGDIICGVRWFESYKGQDVANYHDTPKTDEWGATPEDRRMLGGQGICWMD